jgi:uncharacterized OsmC-like protein
MVPIRVTHMAEDAFVIDVRGHRLMVDQQSRDGDEAGPSPVELFVASVAACAGYYAERFLRRHEQPYQGLRVDCEWTMRAGDPARVGRIGMRITPPAFVPHELREPLRAAIDRCTVHNSLRQPPQVTLELATMPPNVPVSPAPMASATPTESGGRS